MSRTEAYIEDIKGWCKLVKSNMNREYVIAIWYVFKIHVKKVFMLGLKVWIPPILICGVLVMLYWGYSMITGTWAAWQTPESEVTNVFNNLITGLGSITWLGTLLFILSIVFWVLLGQYIVMPILGLPIYLTGLLVLMVKSVEDNDNADLYYKLVPLYTVDNLHGFRDIKLCKKLFYSDADVGESGFALMIEETDGVCVTSAYETLEETFMHLCRLTYVDIRDRKSFIEKSIFKHKLKVGT